MGTGVKILVVEDETIVAADLTEKLRHLGYDVMGSTGLGEQAVTIATAERPTLVLMDIVLAGEMDGIEAADRIRQICNLPIIFLTAHSDSETLIRAKATGPFGYLLKPFNAHELETHIEMALYRYRTEEALREKEERLRLAIDATHVALWDWHIIEDQATWAGHYGELFGRNPDAFQETYEDLLALVHEGDREQVRMAMQRVLEEGVHYTSEFRVRWPDQTIHWLQWWGKVYRDERHRPMRMIGLFQDMTRRRETEDELRRLTADLERRVTDRTEALSLSERRLRGLSRELNLTEQRERQRLATDLHDYLAQLLVLGRIKLGQTRQGELSVATAGLIAETEDVLNQALAYTRSLVGQLCPPVLKEFGLMVALKWLAEQMQQHRLTVSFDAEDEDLGLEEEQAMLLFQSVRELLMNAVKHSRTEQASIRVDHADRLLCIVVQDQGCGFDTTASPGSTQFGLFSIKERMHGLGGLLSVVSELGKGTTATLTLPLNARDERDRREKRESPNLQDSADVELSLSRVLPVPPVSLISHPSRIRILIVDDHAMIREGLKAILQDYPEFELVGEAGNGREAVASTRSLHPDVVIMDVTMPVMDGIEATRLIKNEWPDVIVIGLTVHSGTQVSAALHEAGASNILNKEAAVDELPRTIQESLEILSRSRSRQGRQETGEAGAALR
jgi:PAS domain S-box-containing protein